MDYDSNSMDSISCYNMVVLVGIDKVKWTHMCGYMTHTVPNGITWITIKVS